MLRVTLCGRLYLRALSYFYRPGGSTHIFLKVSRDYVILTGFEKSSGEDLTTFFKKNVQRDSHVGVEAEAKTPVAPSILDLHTLSIPNSENLINGCRPMLTNKPTVTHSEQGNNRSRVGARLKPCFFSRGVMICSTMYPT